ncbi:hypothetical protein BaRGS_00021135 [Batillaria attramentaria]|uniref:Uncharacterized protein n=1 Tax=Batillaria attramentaria TaxID=370345 RepID=A0ABD0KLA0_9CAEN
MQQHCLTLRAISSAGLTDLVYNRLPHGTTRIGLQDNISTTPHTNSRTSRDAFFTARYVGYPVVGYARLDVRSPCCIVQPARTAGSNKQWSSARLEFRGEPPVKRCFTE